TPCSGGSWPVRIVVWDGSVSGTAVRADVNCSEEAASRSSAGATPVPTRSARSVSMVTSRTFGFARACESTGLRPHAVASTATKTASNRRYTISILVRPERGHRIDRGGAPRRKIARAKRREAERQCDADEGERIGGGDAEQQRRQHAPSRECA